MPDPAADPDPIGARLAAVRERIAAACRQAGRDPGEVHLLPVSKTQPAAAVRAAYAHGVRMVGENRVLEAEGKAAELADLTDLRWSVIGHLQTNKVRNVVRFAHEVQSLDSERLAAELDKRLQRAGRGIDVYVQVNSSGEESKFGMTIAEAEDFSAGLGSYASLRPVGLMTVAEYSTDPEVVAGCFTRMVDLRERLRQRDGGGWERLSMGMSGDFEQAIAYGATVVRVGQAVFGPRLSPYDPFTTPPG